MTGEPIVGLGAAFEAYSATAIILCLNLLVLWVSSGGVRARGGIAVNPEDGARYGADVQQLDPPAVARYLRAHRNGEATIYPFLFLGLIFVLAGGGAATAIPIFAVFVIARIAHSVAYLKALQPWRTVAFASSLLALLALSAALAVLVSTHALRS